MDDKLMPLPMKCRCGAIARVRYKIPVVWVECSKKCGMKTGYYRDKTDVHDPMSEAEAILEWNKLNRKNSSHI